MIYIDGARIRDLLSPRDAVDAITAALHAGLDPASDPARTAVTSDNGQMLLMPSTGGGRLGVKVVTVADHGSPRVQGVYLLFDATTLAPAALLDGIALTTLRTPAVSVAAVLPYLPEKPRVAVFGTGPQGRGHVETLAAVRELDRITYLTRRPVEIPGAETATAAEAPEVLADADVVVCATTARQPLFDSSQLSDRAIVIAVGSHEPGAREVDGALLARAHVIVEDRTTAMREAGDVIHAVTEGHLTPADLIPIGQPVHHDRPILFKSTGMAWEDLVIATEVHRRASA
ncbi:ornithine cyclodeaminase [Actinoplanes lutulentus]|uniref:Ornithine cyclodeaminase n=1 Tax=Actinoplanes lutulentus TaxID=1287878 RepID=A0A327YXG1_9ACTN|nr:ornithine cyclodeaminase family protein [Actinoplanes lutulentus]MBB2948941.1 ornithine cyclodeaminase [Actinoplanes lutulentus]RAK26276.1 ornithine cyclodeaminase [Actinoplanes lutulentus]